MSDAVNSLEDLSFCANSGNHEGGDNHGELLTLLSPPLGPPV